MPADFISLIRSRLAAAGLDVPPATIDRLAAYLDVLAHWNRRINLTAFDLAAPVPAAIDRLIVEPIDAARHVREIDRVAIDIGSGGGSPALPLRIGVARPLRMTLVEARAKRSAFLREAVRVLELQDVRVETMRIDRQWSGGDLAGATDVITMRAVRLDAEMEAILGTLTKPGSRLIRFYSVGQQASELSGFASVWAGEKFGVFERQS